MLKSLFSHDCMVFKSRQYHPSIHVRENSPFLLRRNGQTMSSDNWFWRFSVIIFNEIRRGIFLTLTGKDDD